MEMTKIVIFFVGFLVAVCSGLPANKKDEVERVPPVRTYGDQPIVDTGVFSGWDNPFSSNPFGGLFGNLEGIMDRMRQQIAALLNRFPLTRGGNSTEDIPSFPDLFQHPGLPAISGIDLSKGNTTSITKVIDGHTVVINETEYKNEDDFGGTFFKVRIIDVKPDSSEITTEREAENVPEEEVSRDREEVANSIENEITKSKEAETLDNTNNNRFRNIETFDEVASLENVDNSPVQLTNQNTMVSLQNGEWFEEKSPETANPEWNYLGPVKPIDSNDINSKEVSKEQFPVDLSRDTYVNELLAKNGAPTNPDAEVFVVENLGKQRRRLDDMH